MFCVAYLRSQFPVLSQWSRNLDGKISTNTMFWITESNGDTGTVDFFLVILCCYMYYIICHMYYEKKRTIFTSLSYQVWKMTKKDCAETNIFEFCLFFYIRTLAFCNIISMTTCKLEKKELLKITLNNIRMR